jgi:hypothetical protein
MGLQFGYSPLPPFFASGDSRGFKGPVSCVECNDFKLIHSKQVRQRGGGFEGVISQTT